MGKGIVRKTDAWVYKRTILRDRDYHDRLTLFGAHYKRAASYFRSQLNKGTMTMTNYTVDPEFARQSLLVSVNVRSFSARKVDKKVSQKVADDHGASDEAGNYHKNLVPKEMLEPVTKAISAIRDFHYENSLPWLDEGIRCLPSMNYEAYKTEIGALEDAYDTAVRDFCAAWPEVVEKARAQLGTMFNERDYPADIRSKFGFKLTFSPLPTANDFRLDIREDEMQKLRAAVTERLEEGQAVAMADLYRRLGDGVKAMAERLRAYSVDPDTGKTTAPFRDSLVENLRDLVALIPRLNFAQDAELEAVRKLVEGDLCDADAQDLRDSDALREKVADSAEAIEARLKEFMA